MRLSDLESGVEASIIDVHHEGPILQRLLDMGFVPGTLVRVVRNAPLLDPIEFYLRGSQVAVRRVEAAGVEVEKL